MIESTMTINVGNHGQEQSAGQARLYENPIQGPIRGVESVRFSGLARLRDEPVPEDVGLIRGKGCRLVCLINCGADSIVLLMTFSFAFAAPFPRFYSIL